MPKIADQVHENSFCSCVMYNQFCFYVISVFIGMFRTKQVVIKTDIDNTYWMPSLVYRVILGQKELKNTWVLIAGMHSPPFCHVLCSLLGEEDFYECPQSHLRNFMSIFKQSCIGFHVSEANFTPQSKDITNRFVLDSSICLTSFSK